MKAAIYQVDEREILDRIFTYLSERGLENISIRELCRGTGMVQGSLYYWFTDKTTIICEATEYGFKKVADEIFRYALESVDDLDGFFLFCLDKISKYKKEIRFIYQMAASPVYGDRIRKDSQYFKSVYDNYAKGLAEVLNCEYRRIRPIVHLFVSTMCEYAIWEDDKNTQSEIDFIRSLLLDIINSGKQ